MQQSLIELIKALPHMCAPSAAQTYSGFATSNNAELFSAAVKLVNAPADYFNLFTDWPANVTIITNSKTPADCIHLFVVNKGALLQNLLPQKKKLKPAGILWVPVKDRK